MNSRKRTSNVKNAPVSRKCFPDATAKIPCIGTKGVLFERRQFRFLTTTRGSIIGEIRNSFEMVTQFTNEDFAPARASYSKMKMDTVAIWLDFEMPFTTYGYLPEDHIALPHRLKISMGLGRLRTN